MKTEYEVRFLEIDKEKILKKLKEIGAVEVGNWFKVIKHSFLILCLIG